MLIRRGRCSLWLLVAACVVVGATGCASSSPSQAKAVTDIYGIAGRWLGTCNLGSGLEPCNIDIGQDGYFNARAGAVNILGRATVAGGRGTFDAGAVAGDMTVYETNACRRQMVVKGSKGAATGELNQDGATARRVSSLTEVAGRWVGTCDLGSGPVSCVIIIGPDGTFGGSAGATNATGKVAVSNGRAVFDLGPTGGGDVVLHDGAGCKRQIAVVGSRGVARGVLTAE